MNHCTCKSALALLLTLSAMASAQSPGPWWDDYPLIYQGNSLTGAQDYNANISFNNVLAEPGWGTYGQKALNDPSTAAQATNLGLRNMAYFETFGTTRSVILELGTRGPSDEFTPIVNTHWTWQNYSGGTIAWAGAPAWFDDMAFAQPFTRTHPVYGGALMRYPDGTVATGYNGDVTNPLNHRVYDAGASKNVLGGYAIKEDYEPSNATVQSVGPTDGLLFVNGFFTGFIGPGKDPACPWWAEIDYAQVRLAVDSGLDAMWTDNYSAWNNFGFQPVLEGFGEWSVASFRDHLSANFTPSELISMGVADVSTFDIRTYLRTTMTGLGGDDTDLNDAFWSAQSWIADPLWRAYLVHKRRVGTAGLANFYSTAKQAAADAGNNELLIVGNDIPAISLGWPRGDLDMVSTEYNFGWSLDGGSIGTVLPPKGRQGIRYKLAREHAKSRFVNVWPSFGDSAADPNQSSYRTNPNLLNVVFFEMLAHDTTPHALPENPSIAGTQQSLTALFGFIQNNSDTWGDREPVEEVGVFYSSSSALVQFTPGGLLDFDNQSHQFALYGWGMALDKLHYTYRALPEWKLSLSELAQFTVFIVPNAQVLDPAEVAVLGNWVNSGGRLIVTGDSGLRLGESGNFDVNPSGLSLASLTGQSSLPSPGFSFEQPIGAGKVIYVSDNIGANYYSNTARPDSALPGFATLLDSAWLGTDGPVIDAPTVPSTVGFTVFTDATSHRHFVDIYNTDIDLASDTITPTGGLTFDLRVPALLNVPDLTVSAFSPDGPVTVGLSKAALTVSLTVSSITTYASVVFDFPDGDSDGLSDATEESIGTSPDDADSDDDGVSDFDEVHFNNDPDYDPFDPIDNPTGTDLDANDPDTDGDGVDDGLEIRLGTDPLDPSDVAQLPLVFWPAFALVGLIAALWIGRAKWAPRR